MGTAAVTIPSISAVLNSGTPLDIPGIFGWWDFTDATKLYTDAGTTNVTTDGDLIWQVNDKSGNGHHVVQATSGKRATYKTGIVTGHSVGRLAGAAGCGYGATIVSQAQPITYIVVAKQTSKATSARYFDCSIGGPRELMGLNTSGFVDMYAGTSVPGSVDRSGAFHVISVILNGASSRGYCDGTLDASGDAGSLATGTQILNLGSDGTLGGLTGDIVEACMVTSAIAVDSHNRIGRAYAGRYGLTWTTVT